jgi:hypothetical protein
VSDVLRAPLITAIPKRQFLNVEIARNVVLLAALVVAQPFHQTDWPTPTRARIVPQSDIAPNTLLLGIPQTIPFRNDHALPTLRARVVPHGDSYSGVTTRGIPQQIGFNQADWPNPFTRKPLRLDDPPNVAINAPLVGAAPFYKTDWPNPQGKSRFIILGHTASLTTQGIPPPPPVFAIDWQNPVARKPIRFDDPPNLLGSTLAPVAVAPFNKTDWPNPLGRSRFIVLGVTVSLTTQGIPPPPPVLAIDWQNPTARKPQRYDDPPNLLTNTLQAAPTNPFYSVDLGQPFKARIAPLIDIWPNSVLLGIPPPPPVVPPVVPAGGGLLPGANVGAPPWKKHPKTALELEGRAPLPWSATGAPVVPSPFMGSSEALLPPAEITFHLEPQIEKTAEVLLEEALLVAMLGCIL